MPAAMIMFMLSFAGALVLPLIDVVNTREKAIPTSIALGAINLISTYRLILFYGSIGSTR